MATIKIHLLESRVATATYNDVSIESPNNYRIIEGEKNTTQFELVYDQNVWNGYTFSVKMVNSKGYEVNPPTIENNTFTLPDGMATAGYGYIGIKAEKESKVVTFMPVKVKVWDYVEAWKGNVIDRNITFQEFVELENRVEDLEQNGTGGGSVANAVTTDTAQTITGEKTFTQPIFIQDASYEDPYATHGLEIHPHKIVHYDYYIPEEDGFKGEFTFPEGESGTIATQEFVEEYVAENGGGSSADVGEIQFCCIASVSTTTQMGGTTAISINSIPTGTPVVGERMLLQNGFGLITSIVGEYVNVKVEKVMRIGFNGTSRTINETNFYAPLTAGVSGNILVSSGSGAPTWANPATIGGGSSGNAYMFMLNATDDMGADVGQINFTLFGNYTGYYIDTMEALYNVVYNCVGTNIVPANGVWNGTAICGFRVNGNGYFDLINRVGGHFSLYIYDEEAAWFSINYTTASLSKNFNASKNWSESEGEA